MKYALIAMAVIYLITFGCSPEEEKKAADSHKEVTHTAVEATQQSEETAAVAVHQEEADHAVAEQQDTGDSDHQTPVAEEKAPAEEAGQDEHTAVATSEEKNADEVAEQAVEPTPEQPAVEEKAVETAAVAAADQPAAAGADEEIVTMPCGRVMALKDIPAGAPCLTGKAPNAAVPSSEELNAAMLRMVEATNNMVRVTQQMVIATQEMLNASKAAPADAAAEQGDKK